MPYSDVILNRALTETLSAVGATAAFPLVNAQALNAAHLRSPDFVGAYQLEKKFVGDEAWYVVLAYGDLIDLPEAFPLEEAEAGASYRWNMTARTSGSVNVRISA